MWFKAIIITKLISEIKFRWWIVVLALILAITTMANPEIQTISYFLLFAILGMIPIISIWIIFKILGWIIGKILNIVKGESVLDVIDYGSESYDSHDRESVPTHKPHKYTMYIRKPNGYEYKGLSMDSAAAVINHAKNEMKSNSNKGCFFRVTDSNGSTIWTGQS